MKTIIAVPTIGTMEAGFVRSLYELEKPGTTALYMNELSIISVSRDQLAKRAVEAGADYVLWLDDDMTFAPDLLKRLLKTMKDENADCVCGLFFRRRPPYTPAVWRRVRLGLDSESIFEGAGEYGDKPFEIDACGMAATLMKVDMIDELLSVYKERPFQSYPGMGEDISFCVKARKLGYRFVCDPRVKIGHIGQMIVDESVYKAYMEQNAERVSIVDVLGGKA